MKLKLETSHEIKFRAEPENGKGFEASAFIKPYIAINCPELWSWVKEKLNVQQTDGDAEPEQ